MNSSHNLPNRTFRKVFVGFSVFIACLFLLSFAFLPTFLSSDKGNEFIKTFINGRIPGQIETSKVKISWLGPQIIEDLHLKDPQGTSILSMQKGVFHSSLISLLWNKIPLGSFELHSIDASINIDECGKTNIQSAFDKNHCYNSKPSNTSIVLKDLQARVDSANGSIPFAVQITGATQRGDLIGRFAIDAETKEIPISSLLEAKVADISELFHSIPEAEFKINIDMANFPVELLDNLLSLKHPHLAGLLLETLGSSLNLIVEQKTAPDGITFAIRSASPTSSTSINALIADDFSLTEPATIAFKLLPELAEKLIANNAWHLEDSIPVRLKVKHLQLPLKALEKPLNSLDLHSLNLAAALEIDLAAFGDKRGNEFMLRGFKTSLNSEINSPTLSVITNAEASYNGQTTQINMRTKLPKPATLQDLVHINSGDIVVEGEALGIPLIAVEKYFEIENSPFQIIGSKADVTFRLHPSETDLPLAVLQIHTEHLDINNLTFFIDLQRNTHGINPLNISLSLENGMNASGEFRFQVTPEGYQALRKWLNKDYGNEFSLIEPSNIIVKINSLHLPLLQSSLAMMKASANIDFAIGRLVGIDNFSKEKITLNEIRGHLAAQDKLRQINLDLKASGETSMGDPILLSFEGMMKDGFQNGIFSSEKATISLDAAIDNFPVPFLCQDSISRRQIEAILGNLLTTRTKVQLSNGNGPFFMELKGQNANVLLDGHIANGWLTLNKDLQVQMAITPQLGKYVLDGFLPILSGTLSANQPLKLMISRQGFAFPISDYQNPMAISIGKAILEPMQLKFSSQAEIAKVLNLLSPHADQIAVNLTPTYFSLSDGIVKIERVDMLINDSYPIAAWGKVDIGKSKVNMIIGLFGASISKAFNVSGIPNNTLLQLPLKGSLHNASIDRTKAAARLSTLVAQSQGGPQGFVIGTVLDIATGGFTESPPPAPTTNPLPWSQLLENTPESEKKPSESSPIEDIGKEATSLIKQLFRGR